MTKDRFALGDIILAITKNSTDKGKIAYYITVDEVYENDYGGNFRRLKGNIPTDISHGSFSDSLFDFYLIEPAKHNNLFKELVAGDKFVWEEKIYYKITPFNSANCVKADSIRALSDGALVTKL